MWQENKFQRNRILDFTDKKKGFFFFKLNPGYVRSNVIDDEFENFCENFEIFIYF